MKRKREACMTISSRRTDSPKRGQKPVPGKLHLYLGVAPGVGKTCRLLQEAHRDKAEGTDIVVGVIETHGRDQTIMQIGNLEIIAPREIRYEGAALQEMDTDAVLTRHPAAVVVDELAHTNAPGSRHEKRYQDVQELLEAGIHVLSALDVQHLECLRESVYRLTGITVQETVPDALIDQAERVDIVDLEPATLRQRLKQGVLYPPSQTRQALDHFFTLKNLASLRGMALALMARMPAGATHCFPSQAEWGETGALGNKRRIAVAISHHPIAAALISQGSSLARALGEELAIVYVAPSRKGRQIQTAAEEQQLRKNFLLAREYGVSVTRLSGKVAHQLITYCRANQVHILVTAHPSHTRWESLLSRSITDALLHDMPEVAVLMIGTPTA